MSRMSPDRRRLLRTLSLAWWSAALLPLARSSVLHAQAPQAQKLEGLEGAAVWDALARGGALLLRHALTDPGVGDPPGFQLDACATQRNLSAAGRAQAARLGARVRAELAARGTRVDAVLSSRWCRCLDTARLAFPELKVEPLAGLNSFFDARAEEPTQSAAVRAELARRPAAQRLVLVTHMVNISALTGRSVGMGQGIVVRMEAAGLRVVGPLELG